MCAPLIRFSIFTVKVCAFSESCYPVGTEVNGCRAALLSGAFIELFKMLCRVTEGQPQFRYDSSNSEQYCQTHSSGVQHRLIYLLILSQFRSGL